MKFLSLISAALLLATSSFAQKTLWGMAAAKGSINGAIFKTDSAGNGYTDVYTFSNPVNGADPYGSLMQVTDGKLYGLTSRGGTNGFGVLFQVDPTTGTYTKKHDFDSVNGKMPYGSLIQAPNGKLYGMTYGGGSFAPAKDKGVLFEYNPATGVFTSKKNVVENNGTWPYGSFMQGNDGRIYGLTSGGGVDGTGLIFQYDYALDTMIRMGGFVAGPAWEGYVPRGQMVHTTDGYFYGLSRYGQAMGSGGGVIFKFDGADGILDRLSYIYKLSELAPDSSNGYETMGSLIQASDGQLYGMAQHGGANGEGTIFSYDLLANSFTKRHDFSSTTEGYAPYGTLMQASNGMLYGLTTSEGGQAYLFQFDIATNSFTVKANVTGTPYYTALIEVNPMPARIPQQPANDIITVFPNPSHTLLCFSINTPANKAAGYELLDAQGRVLLHGAANTNALNKLDIAQFASGSYLLKVIVDDITTAKTIIKE